MELRPWEARSLAKQGGYTGLGAENRPSAPLAEFQWGGKPEVEEGFWWKKEVGAGVHLRLLVFSATSRQVCVCVAGDKRDRWVARGWGEGLNREWWRALTRLTSKMFGFLWPNAGNLPISEKEVDFPWSPCFSYVWSMFLNSFPLWLLWSRVMMPADNCSVSYRSEREGFS